MYRNLPVVIRCLITASFCCSSMAETLYIDRIGLAQGLSQNTITSIAQDPKGFMWFGTQDGLNRYDGYSFKKYGSNPDDLNSMSGKIVWALLVDKEGVLWIGTLSGLNRYDASTESFQSYIHDPNDPDSLSDNSINALHEDSHGNIWVGTAAGLNRFNRETETFTRYVHSTEDKSSISNSGINAILQDDEGVLWIGTDRGVDRFDYAHAQFSSLGKNNPILSSASVFSLAQDGRGRLWMGTENDGLFVYDKQNGRLAQHLHQAQNPHSLSLNRIRSLYTDNQGRLWVGTDGGGLNRLHEDGQHFIHYRNNPGDPHSLSDDSVYSLFEDKGGVLWIGTYTNGISKLNPYGFSLTLVSGHAGPDDANPLKDARAFLVTQRGELWVASSYNGIKVIEANGHRRHYRHDPNDPHSLSSDKIYSLREDHEGRVWIGAAHGWLNEYDRNTDSFRHYHVQPTEEGSMRHGEVRALWVDREGQLWAGTDPGGVHIFDQTNKTFRHFHHEAGNPNSLSRNEIFSIYEDHRGHLWFATFGGGLNEYDPEAQRFTVYRYQAEANSISNDFPLSMYEDVNNNVLWIATYGSGIDRLDLSNDSFTNFSSKQGLADDSTYGILLDDHGYVWVSHNKGLSRFDPKSLRFNNYDERDGLQSNEFNGGAYYRAADGKLFFGGINGYNAFYPHEITNNPYQPPVYITDFQLFNKPVAINEPFNDRVLLPQSIVETNALTLSHKDYVFSLEFAALDYAFSSKNQYAYKMEGLEERWNYVTDRRFVTYTTLPPGRYTFHVKASNNSGVWNEEGARMAITIMPPFWQTWWFRSLAGFMLILSVFSFYTLRVRAVQARNKMLQKEVDLRTAELRQEKSHLETTLIELGETKDALIEAAHKAGMADTAIGVLHNVGNLLNSVNTSAGVIRETIDTSVSKKFLKAHELLLANKDNLKNFIANDSKGQKLLDYISELGEPFKVENQTLRENALRLKEKIDAIKETIVAQQRFAQGNTLVEERFLKDLVEDSLLLQSGSISRHEIRIERRYDETVPKTKLQKAKFMQVLLNLYQNAKEAMDAAENNENILTIEIRQDERYAYLIIADSGVGLEKPLLDKIFAHGFVPQAPGQGRELHACANYMSEMGGKLWAESDGPGCGSRFIMRFPLHSSALDSHAA